MTDAPVIDGEAIDVEPDNALDAPEPSQERPSVALQRVPTRDVLMPLDATQVIDGMKAYQSLLHNLLDESDWQETNEWDSRAKRKKRFPKKSAWRKIARAFNLALERVDSGVDYADDGMSPIRAWAVYRAIAPNGQTQDGDGYCAISEFTGKRAHDSKLENTMRATATTRAKNRAISDLVGMGEVSAEEIAAAGEDTAPQAPPHGPAADDKLTERASDALRYLLNPKDPDAFADHAAAAMRKVLMDTGTGTYGKGDGYLPWAVARALLWAAAELKAIEEQDQPEEPPA